MKRRDVIKGLSCAAIMMASGKAYSGEYEKLGEQNNKQLLRLKNRDNPSVLEQKHVPAIISPETVSAGKWFDVNVKVGFMKEHPSTSGHWITRIRLLVNGKDLAVTEFEIGGILASSATFRLRMEKTSSIEAVEHCNLHGTWISDPVKITVA